jgi:malate dehydrogenase (oxaloacetate-decarboxylating)(NADP+)
MLTMYRYVFPGIGQGAILSQATRVTDLMVYASGAALPDMLLPEEIAEGMLYPSLSRIREVSQYVILKVIRAAQTDQVDRAVDLRGMSDKKLSAWIAEKMYDPFREAI